MSSWKSSLKIIVSSMLVLFSIISCSLFQSTSVATETPTLESGPRHVEEQGGFSYIPPNDWQIREFPGLEYKIVFGPATDNFSPNINFIDEAFSGSLDDYVSLSMDAVELVFEKAEILGQEEFYTNDGQRGYRVVIENSQEDLELTQVFYFFDTGSKKLVITYTRLTSQPDAIDILVDGCLKTFRIE